MSQHRQKKNYLSRQSMLMLMVLGILLVLTNINLFAAKPPPSPLSCNINPDNGTATTGSGVTFTGSVEGGAKGGKNYSWDFSDGSGSPASSIQSTVNVTYSTVGTFTVSLDVTDKNGDSANCSTNITVTVGGNQSPVANDDTAITEQNTLVNIDVLANDTDADGTLNVASVAINTAAAHGSTFTNADGTIDYTPPVDFAGDDSFTYTVRDNLGAQSNSATVSITVSTTAGVSINSTSHSSALVEASPVPEQAFISSPLYRILAINDLGMHCGDLDTRISSILPPFNVIHSQVVERGTANSKPRIMNQGEVELVYSAVSNPDDPILSQAPVLAKDGSLYKTNFWDIARDAYRPFYPSGILDLFYPAGADIVDVGLPVPDVERFYLEDGFLAAGQQAMPGVNDPLIANEPQHFHEHIGTLPFFINFPFGYKADLNVFEAAGIPIAVYDDFGRPNPYPLMRVQAEIAGETVATVDTVVPISGEAECQRCHADEGDNGNGSATKALIENNIEVAVSIDDPADNVPNDASVEWASDINILRLHDHKHETELEQGYDPVTGQANNPVVCQTCHYTPALDLAQFGPLGPENDNAEPIVLNDGAITIASLANGRDQAKHKSMSNVMHGHHANVKGVDGKLLFRDMPAAVDAQGNKRDPQLTQEILGETCYACHPGEKTECMRGAMANGGQVCQDCHGNMAQVGDDFSRDVSPGNPGAFHLAADYYTNAATPRVPWANEPGCGSCHTGNAIDNLTADADTLVNPMDSAGNTDGIRLAQAFRIGDSKATPIVPVNKQFAENVVSEGTAADGNPKLYRVSTGHAGLFCEACHGATHAEWPNAVPSANDNVASVQLQGHTGTIMECTTCHEPTDESLPLGNNGPHGMHPIADLDAVAPAKADDRWNIRHRNYRNDGPGCESCHGADLKGTVLSRTADDRTVQCKDNKGSLPECAAGEPIAIIPKGTPVGCGLCHRQKR